MAVCSPHRTPGGGSGIAVAIFHPIQRILKVIAAVKLKLGRGSAGTVQNTCVNHQKRLYAKQLAHPQKLICPVGIGILVLPHIGRILPPEMLRADAVLPQIQ